MFRKKTWADRISEYPTRRILTDEDGTETTVSVARSEGVVMQEGDPFNASTMNEMESRIEEAFGYTEFLLSASGWEANTDAATKDDFPYTYTIQTAQFGAYPHDCEVYGASGIMANAISTAGERESMAMIYASEVLFLDNSITLYATDRPTVDLTFYVYG